MAKLTNKYDVVQMGETPDFMSGVYNVLEKYLDPEYQSRIRAEKEEQKRYDTRQQQLIAQQNYNSDISKYNQAKENFNLALSSAKTPTQTKMILDNYADVDKTWTIRNVDGTVDNLTLNTASISSIADDNLKIKNKYKDLEEKYREASNEEKINLYPQLESASRESGIAITPSMTSDFTSAKSYVDNSKVIDFMTSSEFLEGTGMLSEDVNFVKNGLLSGDITDSNLKTYVDFVQRKTNSKEATTKFFQKLYEKSLDNIGKLKLDSEPKAIQAVEKSLEIAKKGLGMDEESIRTQNILNMLYEKAGGEEKFKSLPKEEQEKIMRDVANVQQNTEETEETEKTEKTENIEETEEGVFSKLGNKFLNIGTSKGERESKKVAFSRIYKRDPLQIKIKESFRDKIPNPFNSSNKNKLKDPISGKTMDRNTLLSKMKNNPKPYASLGFIYDPSAKVDYINNNGKESSFMIGYRKVSPKEALQNMNTSFSSFSPRPIEPIN